MDKKITGEKAKEVFAKIRKLHSNNEVPLPANTEIGSHATFSSSKNPITEKENAEITNYSITLDADGDRWGCYTEYSLYKEIITTKPILFGLMYKKKKKHLHIANARWKKDIGSDGCKESYLIEFY